MVAHGGHLGRLSPQAFHAFRVHQAASVQMPYVMIGIALVLLAFAIGRFKLPKIEHVEGSLVVVAI